MRIEEGDDEVDEDGQVEGDAPPQRHPPGEPEEHRHAAQLPLPLHLVVQEAGLLEEVAHLAALLVLLRGGEDTVLRLLRQVLTDGMHWEHNLLHAAVITHDLERE